MARALAMFGGDAYEMPEWNGPDLVRRYGIAIFWLAAFVPSDMMTFERRQDEDGLRYPVTFYRSPTGDAVARLKARTPAVLAITGELYAGFYQEWIAYVERSFPDALLLQPEDILGLHDIETANHALATAIAAFDTHEEAKSRDRKFWQIGALPFEPSHSDVGSAEQAARWCRGALAGSEWIDDSSWPTPPSAAEITAMGRFDPGGGRRLWRKLWG